MENLSIITCGKQDGKSLDQNFIHNPYESLLSGGLYMCSVSR